MAAYDSETRLAMRETAARAREFFEMEHGLTIQEQLGALLRWRTADRDTIELRLFPVRGGGTRLEIETVRNDELVVAFLHALPRVGLLEEIRRRWQGRE